MDIKLLCCFWYKFSFFRWMARPPAAPNNEIRLEDKQPWKQDDLVYKGLG